MPKYKAKFNSNWMSQSEFSCWLQAGEDDYSAKCNLCRCEFSVSGTGICAVRSHATSQKHKVMMKENNRQPTLSAFVSHSSAATIMKSTPTSCEMPSTSSMHCDDARRITILSSDTDPIPYKSYVIASGDILDKISKAEILWCLNVVIQHESYRSCEGLAELFGSMFPDSQIANKFSLGKDKVRYTIVYGLAPYLDSHFKSLWNGIFHIL
jgi:hypothetical protein